MSHTSFLGIPVEGDIIPASHKTDQRPLSELEPLLRAMIEDPTIASFGWRQYTPYFNDGEPCVFGVRTPWVRTVNDPAHDDDDKSDYEYEVSYGHPSLGGRDHEWVDRQRVDKGYVGPDEARYDRCAAFSDAIDSGAFDDVLLEAFGDHADITITAAGITVEFYEHD